MARVFRDEICPIFAPSLHRYFSRRFAEPAAWLDARTRFARSHAAWCAVGHVVGLGDRHGENILVDEATGECVNVDFDCLFDKGLTLNKPEIVPFRLTQHVVDAFGVSGYEGPFRRTMEVTLRVLRAERETLLRVLEPFLRDPSVGWVRPGRSAQAADHAARGGGGRAGGGAAHADAEHAQATEKLRVVSERLRGVYNVRVPRASVWARHRDPVERAGSDAPLSVPGQVQRLIQEATDPENLCQMYMGWMPWC